jgi:predicted amidohydrolase YtcJ
MAAERCGIAEVIAARHRLEHLEMITADLVAEMARLGVTASVQPRFDELWGGDEGMYAARLGRARARTLNPFAALAEAGVTLAFGSDSPVTPLGGWQAVRAAVYHHTPMHRLSVRAAFSAATRGGWRAAGIDDAGVLCPGMLASYAVWEMPGDIPTHRAAASRTDPFSGERRLPDLSPGADLPTCRRTVARGRTVYDRLSR